MARYITILLLLFFTTLSTAQQLISFEFIREESKLELEFEFGIEVRSSIDLYRITYATTGVHNEPDTASGLVAIPKTPFGGTLQLIAYQHGTTQGPDDAPSLLGSGSLETRAYGAMGYVVSSADYLGLGINDAFHPYVHRRTEATAGYDCLRATLELLRDELELDEPDNIFIAGYSQGGHGAMALLQHLETEVDEQYRPTATAAMSGPYDLSGTMFNLMLGEEPYLFVSYPIYVLVGYQDVYGNLYDSLQQVFNDPYIPAIEAFYSRQINLTELTAFVYAQLVADHGAPLTKFLFKDTLVTAMLADPEHRMRQALRDNDSYNWPLETPTRLLYCTADDQVPFRNSLVADSIFKANGVTATSTTDIDPTLTHVACATPAILESLEYFDAFVTSTSSAPALSEAVIFRVSPNPATDVVDVYLEPGMSGNVNIALYDTGGRRLGSWQTETSLRLDLTDQPAGLYILQVRTSDHIGIQKFVKQ